MPTRLTRYILLEICRLFVVTLVALTLLILLIGVGRELLRQGLGPMAVVQLLPYVVPLSLQFALPATALFAVCSVYGRMAADGEVSTIKSVGISPWQILQPAMVFALLLSPIAVYLGDMAVSWGRPGVNRVVLHSVEEIVYRTLRSQRSYSSPKGFSIHVHGVDGRRLLGPTVTVHSGSSDQPWTVTAREGSMELNLQRETLVLRLVDGRFHGQGALRGSFGAEEVLEIPLDKALRSGSTETDRPSEVPLRTVGVEAIRQQRENEINRQRLAAHTGFALLTARWENLAAGAGQELEETIRGGDRRLIRLQSEPWRRWAGGFSCFFFVAVGAPLAVLVRSADYWTSFGLCFIPILLIYYPLFLFGLEQAKYGGLPPYSVWMGNVLLMGLALLLMRRVWQY